MTDPASLQALIHERRQACGKKLQPTYASFLEMLNCVLTNQLKEPHPYRLHEDKLRTFYEQTKLFSLGGIGDEATLTGENYIYRIIKKGHLQYCVNFKWSVFRNPVRLWNLIMAKSDRGKRWLNLQDYVENTYPVDAVNGWFNCTWWTTFPLDQDVILGAYTIGMFSEWVTDEIYIMRAQIEDVNSLNVARVPTVIDAFMQPVFQPTEEPLPRTGGITINLSVYENPSKGVSEFFVKPIQVRFIEIKPIQIDLDTRLRHQEISQKDPLVLQSLVRYYDAL
jgi:hypothetical protein